jgi:hemin uptake protein HemP
MNCEITKKAAEETNRFSQEDCYVELNQCIGRLGAVPSLVLLGDRRSITIMHEGENYLLRLTKFGKLVLTK